MDDAVDRLLATGVALVVLMLEFCLAMAGVTTSLAALTTEWLELLEVALSNEDFLLSDALLDRAALLVRDPSGDRSDLLFLALAVLTTELVDAAVARGTAI